MGCNMLSHYEEVLKQHCDAKTRKAFAKLDPSEHHQWVLGAIAERKASGNKPRYIAKVTLVHQYEALNSDRADEELHPE